MLCKYKYIRKNSINYLYLLWIAVNLNYIFFSWIKTGILLTMPFLHPVCWKTMHCTEGCGIKGYKKTEGRSFHACFIQTILWQQKAGFITPVAMTIPHKGKKRFIARETFHTEEIAILLVKGSYSNVTVKGLNQTRISTMKYRSIRNTLKTLCLQ